MAKIVFMLVAIALLAFSPVAPSAEQYPTRALRFVIGFPAGGPTDAAGRILGQALSQSLGQQVVIDNRPGADGAIAPELVAKAAPDGYTILLGNANSMAAVPAMRKNPPYDSIADFVPIVFIAWNSGLVVVHPSVPAKTIAELIQYARANPGKLNVAAVSPTSIFTMAHLNATSKITVTNITYKGDVGAMADLLSGRVDVMIGGTNLVLPFVKEGKLRALAAITRSRTPPAPDVPTMVEAGVPGFNIYNWFALFGPAKTPNVIVDRLAREVNAVLKRPDIEAQFNRIGFDLSGPTQQELPSFLKEQKAAWAAAARDGGIQPQ